MNSVFRRDVCEHVHATKRMHCLLSKYRQLSFHNGSSTQTEMSAGFSDTGTLRIHLAEQHGEVCW